MSYYQKRSVLAKSNNSETIKRWHSVVRQLKEKNEDMASVEEILAEAEKNNGVLEFEFEYYSGEAFNEYEDLLKEAESSDNEDGVVVKLDSDYGSYISTYGNVEKEVFTPKEERWSTGTFASAIINIDSEKLAEWIECEEDEIEDSLVDNEEQLAELFGVDEYEDIELEVESYDEDDDKSIFQLGLGFDFFRFGTLDDLADNYIAIQKMKDKIVSMGGTLTLGQSEILLLKDKGECDWIAEEGFKELRIESTADKLGEFVATHYVIK